MIDYICIALIAAPFVIAFFVIAFYKVISLKEILPWLSEQYTKLRGGSTVDHLRKLTAAGKIKAEQKELKELVEWTREVNARIKRAAKRGETYIVLSRLQNDKIFKKRKDFEAQGFKVETDEYYTLIKWEK